MKIVMPEKPTLADFPHLVTHRPGPDDIYDKPAGDAPKEPFEALGADVVKLSWENRDIRRSRFPMPVPDFANENLQRFREKYSFLKVIQGVEDEWQRLLLLRNWVHHALPNNVHAYKDRPTFFVRPYPVEVDGERFNPFRVLDQAATGCRYWCPHYSQTLRAVLTACGYVSRHVGNISFYSEKVGAHTHGVTDCFVQKLGKWVQLDAHFDLHYAKDGVPLSPFELGEEWHRNGGKDVTVHTGPESKTVPSSALSLFDGEHESSRAFWNQHRWYMDPFSNHGTWFGNWDSQLVLVLTGKRHEGILAYRGTNPGSEADAGYSDGRIQYTVRSADIYPDVGTSHLLLEKGPHAGTIHVRVGTLTPNLATLEVRVDEQEWADQDVNFLWFPHEGENVLRVRTRDKFGNRGRESSVCVVLKKKG